MRHALVVIDMQVCFLERHVALTPPLDDAIEVINHVAGALREAGHPVIWVRDHETIAPTDPRGRLHDLLHVDPADPHVEKVASNVFVEPGLPELLDELEIDFVWFCGYRAEQCVLATARGAADRGLSFALLRGAVLGPDSEAVAFVERLFPLASHEVITGLCAGP
ncbi:MAG: cysteine hydrolase family protein [Planctomycetota bacterium]